LTLHEEQVSLPALLAPDLPSDRGSRYVVYAVLDAMLTSTFDALEEVELTLDALAATLADEDGSRIAGATLREAGSRFATMSRWVTAEQVVFARLSVEVSALRGFRAADVEAWLTEREVPAPFRGVADDSRGPALDRGHRGATGHDATMTLSTDAHVVAEIRDSREGTEQGALVPRCEAAHRRSVDARASSTRKVSRSIGRSSLRSASAI